MSEHIPKSPLIPSELEQLYGDNVPHRVLEMYSKLKGREKRESYLATLIADEAGKKERRTARLGSRTKEGSFDPHSVATAQTVREQRQPEEMRGLLAGMGTLPPEAVRPPDVDIRDIYAPQYATRAGMQKDMDRMVPEAEPVDSDKKDERTPQEWRKELRNLIEGAGE